MTAGAAAATRTRLIRAVHAKARQLGISDEDRETLQVRAAGAPSCRDMDVPQLRAVLREMDAWKRLQSRRDEIPDGPVAAKLRALWISGWHLGVVEDRSEAALAAWLRRQSGVEALPWAAPASLSNCVEALKAWLARDGGVDWSPYATEDGPAENPRGRVLEAQWRRLAALGRVRIASAGALHEWARKRGVPHYLFADAAAQDRLVRVLGDWIRA